MIRTNKVFKRRGLISEYVYLSLSSIILVNPVVQCHYYKKKEWKGVA